jgi:hypothetical protein
MAKEYRKDPTPPSEMFKESLSGYGVGSDELECGWCGRIHLCPDSSYFDTDQEGDARRVYCEEEYRGNPDRIVLHYGVDGVSAHEMNDILFVVECPCNGLYRFEAFIWKHKSTIENYLPKRYAQEERWDEEELTVDKLIGPK